MKDHKIFYLSFAAPCLVLIAILGFFQRKDNDRVQSLPAFVSGIGFVTTSFIGRNMRRKKLLTEIFNINNDVNS